MTRLLCRFVLFFLSIFSLTVLISCSSILPFQLPSLQNPAQTLLIVVIESSNPLNVHTGIETCYQMKVPECDEIISIRQRDNYAVGKSIPSGSYDFVYLTQRVIETQGGGWCTNAVNNEALKMPINFEVKPGYINFFPVKFTYAVTMFANGTSSTWAPAPITKADMEKVLTQFRNNKNFNQWKVDL